jgi:cytochrome c peroxidase
MSQRTSFICWLRPATKEKCTMGDKKKLTTNAGCPVESGCIACHNGEAVGGTSFREMGIVKPCKAKSTAEGRSAVTGKAIDRFTFKVPILPPSTDNTLRPRPFGK